MRLSLLSLLALVPVLLCFWGCSSTPLAPSASAPFDLSRADVSLLRAKLPAAGEVRFTIPSGKAAVCRPTGCTLTWTEARVHVGGKHPGSLGEKLSREVEVPASFLGELLFGMDEARSKSLIFGMATALGHARCRSNLCEVGGAVPFGPAE